MVQTIKAHGGEIKVETKEEEHAEFIIQWPMVRTEIDGRSGIYRNNSKSHSSHKSYKSWFRQLKLTAEKLK